jgi:ribosomal protein S15P/S13E
MRHSLLPAEAIHKICRQHTTGPRDLYGQYLNVSARISRLGKHHSHNFGDLQSREALYKLRRQRSDLTTLLRKTKPKTNQKLTSHQV